MSTPKRLLLSRQEAADMLGVSLSHFKRYVQPGLPCVYSGRLRRFRPRDLERYVDQQVTSQQAA